MRLGRTGGRFDSATEPFCADLKLMLSARGHPKQVQCVSVFRPEREDLMAQSTSFFEPTSLEMAQCIGERWGAIRRWRHGRLRADIKPVADPLYGNGPRQAASAFTHALAGEVCDRLH